jgi:rod shape determining protein RodA
MNNFDRMLSSEDVMRRRATLLQRLHIDGPLLILLLTLAAGSLFVLYSAVARAGICWPSKPPRSASGWCR